MTIPANRCIYCEYYLGWERCKAFQDGIPKAIVLGEHDHRKPYPGDNGIRFEPIKETKPKRG